jgi:hypothetical protein
MIHEAEVPAKEALSFAGALSDFVLDLEVFLYREAVVQPSPGSRQRTLGTWPRGTEAGSPQSIYPVGVVQRRTAPVPGCAGATLGWVVQPLRGKEGADTCS